MNTVTYLAMTAAAVVTLSISQADEPRALAAAQKSPALFTSPRYLEQHPELLRRGPDGTSPAAKAGQRATLTGNSALAASPRFRETHPELRWTPMLTETPVAQFAGDHARLNRLTENKALAASPRFLEQHPELLRGEARFEIAPLK